MTPTRELARWVSALTLDDVPDVVLEHAKHCLIDAIACAGAGAAIPEVRALGVSLWPLEGCDGPGRPWFTTARTSVFTEAFWNATLIHAMDYDDSHKRSKTHPGAAVWSAVIAASRAAPGVGLGDLVAGAVAGYETTMRLANALGVERHRRLGWHATATCGTVGAAVAASRVLRLDAQQTASAVGLGVTQAAGTWAFREDGSLSKKMHAGHAARAGVTAAASAGAGLSGSGVGLEAADGGFFAVYAPGSEVREWASVLADIARPYWLPEVAFKPYPCCRTAHTAADAALALRASGVRADQIRRVEVRTYTLAVEQCGFHDPVNHTQAAFSTPYIVAAALRDGAITVNHFTADGMDDAELRQLHKRVEIVADPRFDDEFPQNWPAEVSVELVDGTHAVECVDVALGDPLQPMSSEQSERKLIDGLTGQLDEERIDGIVQELREVDIDGDMTSLWSTIGLLRPREG